MEIGENNLSCLHRLYLFPAGFHDELEELQLVVRRTRILLSADHKLTAKVSTALGRRSLGKGSTVLVFIHHHAKIGGINTVKPRGTVERNNLLGLTQKSFEFPLDLLYHLDNISAR